MADIDRIVQELKRLKKIDFSGYSRAMLTRRIDARMSKLGIGGCEEYLDRLRTDVSEGGRGGTLFPGHSDPPGPEK